MKFTPSTKSNVDTESGSSSTDPLTRPRINDRNAPTSANKREKLGKGIHAGNILPTSSRSSRQRSSPSVSDEEAPSPKRQRVTRHQGHNPLNYDSRLHPLDRCTRPSHFAKVNAEYSKNTTASYGRDSLDGNIDNNFDPDERSSQASQEADPEIGEEADADTVQKEEPVKVRLKAVKVVLPSYSPSPGSRRSSRNSRQRQRPNYNMK